MGGQVYYALLVIVYLKLAGQNTGWGAGEKLLSGIGGDNMNVVDVPIIKADFVLHNDNVLVGK